MIQIWFQIPAKYTRSRGSTCKGFDEISTRRLVGMMMIFSFPKMAAGGTEISHSCAFLDGGGRGGHMDTTVVSSSFDSAPTGVRGDRTPELPKMKSLEADRMDPPCGISLESPETKSGFLPVFRSGSCSVIGARRSMEDEHICIDVLEDEHCLCESGDIGKAGPRAFYGVFDGHGGMDAARFIRENILKLIMDDQNLHTSVSKALISAFVKADHAFADDISFDRESGSTALTALIFGRKLYIANAGDCRAVMGRRGRAAELSKDHRPSDASEKVRIEKLGGVVYDGYLNGDLAVSRAIGDWHMKGAKGSPSPLSAEPEVREATLTEEDEFLILGCDGLWDVMSSQCAVSMARKELRKHNDPERCSMELVNEALRRDTGDNLTVVTICFSPDPPPAAAEFPGSRFRRRSICSEGLRFIQGVMDRKE